MFQPKTSLRNICIAAGIASGIGVILVTAAPGASSAATVESVPLDQVDRPPVGATKGTIPPEVFDSGETAAAPDYIAFVGNGESVIGYIAREFALPSPEEIRANGPTELGGEPRIARIPVWSDDLTAVVGYYEPGIGFTSSNDAVQSYAESPPTTAAGARADKTSN